MTKKDELHAKLKVLILTEASIDDTTNERYRIISEDIFSKTKNYISKTTIKRFFEIGDEDSTFSPFVLNSLVQYLGFDSWQDFSESDTNNNKEVLLENNEDNLKRRI